MRFLYLCILLSTLLHAEVTLSALESHPNGHIRNFHIWQFLHQDITPEQADAAYCLVDGYNSKIFNAYAKKTNNRAIKEQYRCSTLDITEVLNENNVSCVNRALSLKKTLKLTSQQRLHLAHKLRSDYPKKSKHLTLIDSKRLVLDLLEEGPETFLLFFNSLGAAYRQNNLNIKLSSERINELAKHKAFNKAVKYIVTDPKMHRMQEALLLLQPHDFNDQTYFFLALNALKFKATKKAMFYLEIAQKKAYYQMDKDKALFWKYLITKNGDFLTQLTQSSDINIYTLYANEHTGNDVTNYFIHLPLKKQPSTIDLKNPYHWQHVLDEIRSSDEEKLKQLQEKYSHQDDEVLSAFIYAKSTKYKTHNYIMPYKDATKELSNDDKAILYALAKQESHFIPSAISRSYALGVMQLMPFLVKALAKQKNEKIRLEEMFEPKKNIDYAKTHLQYLQKYLYHPLFIAYAYNGGIGFTKRHLLKGNFSKGSFEPFLSMELIANSESREYGKKVLANYVIYKKILNEQIRITSLFEMLTQPAHTDRFRTKDL